MSADPIAPSPSSLPPDDALRGLLHNEVHARPSARIRLPALVVLVAVLNEGVSREDECAHLRRLPGQDGLQPAELADNFLRLRLDGLTLKWERHSEFTRYSLVQPLPQQAALGASDPELLSSLALDASWLREIPGRTVAAVKLVMLEHDISDPHAALALAQQWFGGRTVVASMLGNGHSMAVTNFRLMPSGFERMLVIAPPGTSETRAGRVSQRLLELEIYRLMALRGLPVAKALAPMLAESEAALAEVTAKLEARQDSEAELLDSLIHVAAGVERATAQHLYRFSATQAYDALVRQRIAELREKPIPGTQTIGEFMQRRLSPAIATVVATSARLASLSQRIERASALLRTRVDIATETQNQQLLAKLTRGQDLQLQLQSTVEGLSIAAISYYVVSLLLYGVKALKSAGLPLNPEITTGALIPLVLWGVWKATQRVHARLNH
ncbi:MAG: DUF3422 domain-containing protein [Methylibium sp.]|nr:DUF3422 domain-containing protein [Methylibium sp.]